MQGKTVSPLLAVALAYAAFLGRFPVALTGDQRAYLNIALEMRERGSWWVPWLFGEPSYLKPPLEYWATLLGWKIFGLGALGAFAPSALAAVATAWALQRISSNPIFGKPARGGGPRAGVLFAGALGTAVFGWSAQMEIYLALFWSWAWAFGLEYLGAPLGSRSRRWLWAAFLSAGLLGLVKSPLYTGFWIASFGLFLFLSGEWDIVRSRGFGLALLGGILLGASWSLERALSDGGRFWSEHVVRESVGKIRVEGHGSVASLWGGLAWHLLPWLPLLVASAPRWRKLRSRFGILALSWAAPMAVFFTAYPYRNSTYLYPLVPLACLWLDRVDGKRIGAWATGALIAAGGALVFAVLWLLDALGPWEGLACFASLALGLWGGALRRDWLPWASLALAVSVHAGAGVLGEMDVAGLRERAQSRVVGILEDSPSIWNERAWLSCALGREVAIVSPAGAEDWLRSGGILVGKEGMPAPPGAESLEWRRWKTRVKLPLGELPRDPTAYWRSVPVWSVRSPSPIER